MKVLRILVGLLFLLGFIYLSIWGLFFRTWKLQIAGHQVIESDFNLLSSFTTREFFIKAALSPDQKTLVVAVNIGRKWYDQDAKTKIVLFELSTGKRLWEIENKNLGTSFYSQFLWSKDGSEILAFNFLQDARVIQASNGKTLRTIPNLAGCVWIKSDDRIVDISKFFCGEVNKVSFISNKDYSIIWTKSFQDANKLFKVENMFDATSPDKKLLSFWGGSSTKILDAKTKQEKFPEFTTLWSTNSLVWSPDSSVLAIGGDNYAFKGVDGEDVQAIKNALVVKLTATGIQKRRLFTYGESVRVIGFIDNGRKLVGLTETTIIIWDLQK